MLDTKDVLYSIPRTYPVQAAPAKAHHRIAHFVSSGDLIHLGVVLATSRAVMEPSRPEATLDPFWAAMGPPLFSLGQSWACLGNVLQQSWDLEPGAR